MDLHVIFRGMCLFVPAQNGVHVAVIFPETSGHHPSHPPHRPLLSYKGIQPRPLPRSALHFAGLAAGGPPLTAPIPHLLRAGEIANKKVSPGKLGDHPGATVATRVTLPAPNKFVPGRLVWFTRVENGVTKCLELTHQVTLEYHDVNGNVMPRAKELGNPGNFQHLPEPQANGNVIQVEVTHLPDFDIPICPGEEITHSHMYYHFLEAPHDSLFLDEKPTTSSRNCGPWFPFCGPPHPVPEDLDAMEKERWSSSSAFNCMLAQAPAG